MTELRPKDTSTVIGEQIKQLSIDPELKVVIDEAEEYNKLLLMLDVSDKDCEKIVESLNQKTRPFIGSDVKVSGWMTMPVMDIGEEPDPSTEFDTLDPERTPVVGMRGIRRLLYDEQLCNFQGFQVLREPIVIDDEEVASRVKIVFSLVKYCSEEEKDLHPGLVTMTGSADLSDILIEPSVISFEYAKRWLTYFESELMEEIGQILYAPDIDIYETWRRLSKIKIKFLYDAESQKISRASLELYLNTLLSWDKNLPYTCMFKKGDCIIFKDAMTLQAQLGKHPAIISIIGFKLLPISDDEKILYHEIAHELLYHHEDENRDGTRMWVPLKGFESIHSMRSIFYSTAE